MAIPAAVYLLFNYPYPAQAHGWAIPAATDIAFAVGLLSLAGRHVPPAAKVFLLAVAIYDDLGAILIIALFYSSKLHVVWLGMAAAVTGLLFLCNRFRLGSVPPYIILMFLLVWLLHHGGIHSTIAGVITGLAVPLQRDGNDFHAPLHRMLHAFHPWVAFGILPLFALLNAGISLDGMTLQSLEQPVTAGTALGLILGKPLGILLMVALAVKLRLSPLPENTGWRTLAGIAYLAGIGFTMSLFIQALAFPQNLLHQQEAKIGILAGSAGAALLGMGILRLCKPQTISVTTP
jgi:NhaA family Na+:H+ antiporter